VVLISGRRFHFGMGAGAAPGSRWAKEHDAAGHRLVESLEDRQARVEQVLELCRQEWAADRDERFATFPLPSPVPVTLVGASSERLSRIAGRSADGINVAWHDPKRDLLLAAADEAACGRPFVRTVWTHFDPGLLDPDHPTRRAVAAAGIDRLILAELGVPRLHAIAG
jgi:alkanesulfonate monooxygenase SsuD/methylene tetrahydromethanopterin reductase-like flavin-dependent oxidoreductase (luciferase family)